MKWASTVSDYPDIQKSMSQCIIGIKEELRQPPDLMIAFVSSEFSTDYDKVLELRKEMASDGVLIGCCGNGIIGAGKEIEQHPGFALAGAILPNIFLHTFQVKDTQIPDGDAGPDKWEQLVGLKTIDEPDFVILSDPFSIRISNLVQGLDYAFPNNTTIGGISSGGRGPGENVLYLNDDLIKEGAIGLAITGDAKVDTIVAQGCKPIGKPLRVTQCERNLLKEIDNTPPFQILENLYPTLDVNDRGLFEHSLFLGMVMDPFNDNPTMGDFLIRNILGADRDKNIISVGEFLREGQIVQFHLRDAKTSSDELSSLLANANLPNIGVDECGALIFSCLGRGKYLFGKPDHDTGMFKQQIGEIPLTGFFCNGEIGPVAGNTYIHGYTSSFGIISPK